VLQAVFCVVTVYLAALVWPDYHTLPDKDTAILDIGRRIGGTWMFGFLTFVLLVAGLASALTGQAGASRLLFGMGRDGVISHRIFGYIDPRYSTPTRSIYLMGAISLIGALQAGFQAVAELLEFRRVRRIHSGKSQRHPALLHAPSGSAAACKCLRT